MIRKQKAKVNTRRASMPPVRIPFPLLASSARPFDVVGLGQNSVDLLAVVNGFPRSNTKHRLERFTQLPGGQIATSMVCCARLGWRARYVGRFGSDELGRFGLESLRGEGVDVSASKAVEARTRTAIVLVDSRTGDRTVLWDRDPALAIRPGDVEPDVWASARALARGLRRHRRGDRGAPESRANTAS